MQGNKPIMTILARLWRVLMLMFAMLFRGTVNGTERIIRPTRQVDPFDLNFPLLSLSPTDFFCVSHAVEGVHISGGNGSGKSSGPGKALIKAYMRAGMGMLVLTAKPGEYDLIRRYAEETGCLKRLIRFSTETHWRFNILAYLQKSSSRGGGLTSNIVAALVTIQEAMEKGNSGNRDQYWRDTLNELLTNCVDLCLLARPNQNLSVELLHDVISSAPTNVAQLDDPNWLASSLCFQLCEIALNNPALTPRQQSDLKITGKYWLTHFPQLASETRSSIVSTFTALVDPFVRGPMATLFGTDLNITPEFTFDGFIIVLDLPAKSFGKVGIGAQTLFKYLWQGAVERRNVAENPRPVALVVDESHLFVNEHDALFATTSRSSKACILFLSQTIANYTYSLGGEQKGKALTSSLLDVLQTKFFCSNASYETNLMAADTIGKIWTDKQSSGVNHGGTGTRSSNSGSTDSLEHAVEPSIFQSLKKGGESNQYIVQAIVHGGGRVFTANGKNFILTAFDQRA